MRTAPQAEHERTGGCRDCSRQGMTLIEVVIATAMAALMCTGLYVLGMRSHALAEHNRLATEARSLAKERLEEMIGLQLDSLSEPTCTALNVSTNLSTLGYPIVRQPVVSWHTYDGSATNRESAVYAEAHVDVSYRSPYLDTEVTETFSTLIR